MSQPSVDGTPEVGNFGYNNSSHGITLSTTTSGVVICSVNTETNNIGHVSSKVASVSGAGLTWLRRWQNVIQLPGDVFRNQEIWWAVSSGAISSQTITVDLDGAADGATMIVFGVMNCTGWDPNLELPQTGITTSPITYNTDNADSLVLVFQNSGGSTDAPTAGGGGPATLTFIADVRDASGFGNQYGGAYSGTQSSQISAGTVTMPSGYSGIVDVLTDDSATPYNAPFLDGSNYGIIGYSTDTTTFDMTTTGPGEIVVLVLTETNSGSSNGATVASVTAAGLTFTQRGQALEKGSSGGSPVMDCEEWVAYSSTAQAAVSITVLLNANVDGGAVVMLGFSGVGASVPFDTNVSVPGFDTADNVTGLSTDNQYDMLIWWSSSGSNAGQSGLPSGFTQIATSSYNGGFGGIGIRVGIGRVNTMLSSSTITAGAAGTDVINMVDALQYTAPPPPTIISVDAISRVVRLRRTR